jgi:hypothetical protein
MLSCSSIVVGAALALWNFASASVGPPAQHYPDPMILFVAKGKPNACGPGCSEWIAADGTFDWPGVEQRFRDFFASLHDRNLPIFFNSRGGNLRGSLVIGRLLRERRMTAAVGKTLPSGCRNARDPSCGRLVKSGRELKAELRTSDAICHSACVFALAGASVRRVGDARLGVHGGRKNNPKAELTAAMFEQVYADIRRYLVEMGVSSKLMDLAVKTPPEGVHILTRSEIAQVGIESRSHYETDWFPYENAAKMPLMLKAITQPNGPDGKEFRTTRIILNCGPIITSLTYQREVASNEVDVPSIVHLAVGGTRFTIPPGLIENKIDRRMINPGRDFVEKALAERAISFTETFSPADAPEWSRDVKLSTVGLEQAFERAFKACNQR